MAVADFQKIAQEVAERARRTQGTAPAPGLVTTWADDIEIDLSASGLIDGLLVRTGLSVLYGESGAGKTFVALDMACRIATGLPWNGMPVEAGIVIYVAAEAPESVKRRLWAWKKHHRVEKLPVLVVQSSINLLSGDADSLVELVKTTTRDHGRVAMVVIDTLARSMIGNENSPEDMGEFVDACSRIREAGETHVLAIHHSGKDTAKGARGHSSLRAATDAELEVTKGAITVTKARDEDSSQSARYGFRLESVELGENAKGRMVTTCVPVAIEPQPRAETTKATSLTGKQKTVLDCLHAALVDHGDAPPLAPDIPRNTLAIPFARWCEAAMRYLPGDGPDWRKREDFKRTAESLQAKGLVRHVDGWCWAS